MKNVFLEEICNGNYFRQVLIDMPENPCIIQTRAEPEKSALPICYYSQILYRFFAFTQNLKRSLQEICDKSGIIPSSSVTGSTNAQSYIINESMLNILQMLKSMLTMLVVFAISTTLFYMLIKIDKNKRYYSILLLNGFSINQVRAIIFGNIIIPIILADFISCIIVSFVSVLLKLGSLPLGSMLAVNIILFLMVFIASCIKLIYIDIVSNIGGTE